MCAALGHQRAAHVRRRVRDHAANRQQDERSDRGLGSRLDLGVRAELRLDGGRLHRAHHPQDNAARGAARHVGGRLGVVHLDAARARDVHDAGHWSHLFHTIILASWFGGVRYFKGIPARPRRDRGRQLDRLGLDRARLQLRRHVGEEPGRFLLELRLLGAATGLRSRVSRLQILGRDSGDRDSVRHLRLGRGAGQRRERGGRGRRFSDHARAHGRRRRQLESVAAWAIRSSTPCTSVTRVGRRWAAASVTRPRLASP